MSPAARLARDTALSALAILCATWLSGVFFGGDREMDPVTREVPPSREHLRFWMVGFTTLAALTFSGVGPERRAWLHQLGVAGWLGLAVVAWVLATPIDPPSHGDVMVGDLRPLLLIPLAALTLLSLGLAPALRRAFRKGRS
ncbi:MAG: hypothetical protein H6828_12125 [Planctomycetes bacterium]|nr:hypothetical protein [Planctomycetota bacterium]